MKALILAAGKGERLKPLTDAIPKPMVEINKKPVLEYLILLCKKHGIKDIAINTSYLPEKIKDYFGDGKKWGVNLKFSFEPELLGTSGALNNFRDFFKDESFFVIYGDNVTDLDLAKMMKYHKEKKAFVTSFLHKQKNVDEKTTPGVVIFDDENRILKIIERPTKEEQVEINKVKEKNILSNSGIYILESKILEKIPTGYSDFSKDIFPLLLQEGNPVYAYVDKGCYFEEVGQMNRYLLAKDRIESGKIKLNI